MKSNEETPAAPAQLPSFEHLCVDKPLYSNTLIDSSSEDHKNYLAKLRRSDIQFDAHCLYCKKSSTFKDASPRGGGAGLNNGRVYDDWMFRNGFFTVELHCTRQHHSMRFNFLLQNNVLQKIGQYPSMEDIAGAGIEKYRKILGSHFAELRRATGLASHGIGIGAFVYLRRIFEKLIYDTYDSLQKASGPVEGFNAMRMDEKIKALSSELPAALVKNRVVYGILSKGIHELDEETCRDYFAVVRAAIIQMLEQEFQRAESIRAEADIEREIQAIAAKVKTIQRED